ncbi:3'-5' exonuclease [Streptomyces sp. CMB-StM0423]|uniref:3'-5' exonuclease n=1 Tax=Streptomyces sp. CMB-StM0423 TaxID=2059884 RepID=UPI0026D74D9C
MSSTSKATATSPPDLVEVAALPLRAGTPDVTTAGWWLIRPPRPVTGHASRIHGITNHQLATCPAWADVADEVRDTLHGAWFAAHNASTDYQVLARHLPGWEPAGVLDTLRLTRHTYPDAPGHGLDALIEHLGLDVSRAPAQRHRATFDAYAAAQLLLLAAAHYATWQELISAAIPPGPDPASRLSAHQGSWLSPRPFESHIRSWLRQLVGGHAPVQNAHNQAQAQASVLRAWESS